ncbi:MAG: serine/threonine protein kinase, partial [Planctomycetes bacterium]|nr:serine/threonine protein kinase [Planctomycetota bacterium]
MASDQTLQPGGAVQVGGQLDSSTFGDYEIIQEIARGGMGVVYKARQVSLNRTVALKKILSGQLAGEEDLKRFQVEAEASAQLDHVGIVPVYDFGQVDGQYFFSMGFIEGDDLAERIRERPMEAEAAAEMMIKIAQAVGYANAQGVIHRDLKPSNVLLDAQNEPKVTDFGVAKQQGSDSEMTAQGQILGTPSYMPPEQAAGQGDGVDQRADVYALGAILYALLTGRPPFQAATAMETMIQVLDQDPVPISQLNSSIPRDLETICLKCL